MSELTKQIVIDYLSANHILTLSTVDPEQIPWSTPVFYANSGLTIFFVSNAGSRHSLNIKHNHTVAASIYKECYNWKEIKGIQLQGEAQLIPKMQQFRAWKTYFKKFPFVRDFVTSGEGILKIGSKLVNVKIYAINIHKAVLTDNAQGFANKQELVIVD